MANILLAYNNRADAASYAAGSWVASGGVALSNLGTKDLGELARSSSAAVTSTRLRVAMAASYTLRALGLINHNLSTAATVRMRAGRAVFDVDWASYTAEDRATFAGGAGGTRVTSAGLVASASTPRINHNPVSLAVLGLLIEAQMTNPVLRSGDLSDAAWTSFGAMTVTSGAADPAGGTAGVTLNDTDAGNLSVRYQDIAVANDSTQRTVPFFLKQGTAAESAVQLIYGGGTALFYNATVNWTTKTVTASGDAGANDVSIEPWYDGYYRVSVRGANNSSGNTNMRVGVYPAGTSSVAATGTCIAWGGQAPASSYPASYIPTTTAQVTRAADVVTGSGLVYCTTAEPASGETLWDAATNYTVGQVAARTTTHHLYENLIAGVNATLPELATTGATPRWLDLGATNRWSQFDQKIGTATTSTTSLTTIVKPGLGEGLALLDLIGVTAKISATDAGSGVVIFERTVDLDSTTIESVFDWMFSDRVQKRNVVITDIPAQYPNMVVAVTIESTTGSAIGVFAVGRAIFIGATEYGAGAGIINFGKVTDDGFGNRTWIEGDWANRVTLPMVGNTSDFNRIHRQLATVRSTPCIYIGSALDSMEPLVCYGVFRDLYITVPNYPSIAMNLEIDGMSNS